MKQINLTRISIFNNTRKGLNILNSLSKKKIYILKASHFHFRQKIDTYLPLTSRQVTYVPHPEVFDMFAHIIKMFIICSVQPSIT